MGAILIAGAGGFVGARLAADLRAAGIPVVTAGRGHGLDLCFDLHDEPGRLLRALPCPVDDAVVACGIASVDACSREPARARLVNVERTRILLAALLEHGIRPIFLSSDLVFGDGALPHREGAPRRPLCAYGRFKAEIEDFLWRTGRPAVVIRAAKLVNPADPTRCPLVTLARRARAGLPVRAARDQWITPTFCGDLSRLIRTLLPRPGSHLVHVAGDTPTTRFALAHLVAGRAGHPEAVRGCGLAELRLPAERPRNARLDNRRLREVYGVAPTALGELLRSALEAAGGSRIPGPRGRARTLRPPPAAAAG